MIKDSISGEVIGYCMIPENASLEDSPISSTKCDLFQSLMQESQEMLQKEDKSDDGNLSFSSMKTDSKLTPQKSNKTQEAVTSGDGMGASSMSISSQSVTHNTMTGPLVGYDLFMDLGVEQGMAERDRTKSDDESMGVEPFESDIVMSSIETENVEDITPSASLGSIQSGREMRKRTHFDPDSEEQLGGKKIICNPGQFTTGRKQLSKDTGISESKIERLLNKFEKIEQQITQQKTNINRLISICNCLRPVVN